MSKIEQIQNALRQNKTPWAARANRLVSKSREDQTPEEPERDSVHAAKKPN